MKLTIIYHNPRCSKSIQTLALLRDKGVEPERIAFLSFTKKAAQEAVDRACLKFGFDLQMTRYQNSENSIDFESRHSGRLHFVYSADCGECFTPILPVCSNFAMWCEALSAVGPKLKKSTPEITNENFDLHH